MMIKRLVVVVLAASISLASASGFAQARDFENYSDSLRRLPPRMRPFFDQEYRQQSFNAPLQESLNVRCVGRWPFGPSYEVTAQRDTLYLASGSGVRIVDITTPTNPRHIGQICAKGLVNQVVIRDSLLYVASRGLEIFNVSNPTNPIKRSWLNIPVSDFGLKDSFAVCIAESLRIINIKNPSNPVRVGASADSGYSIFVTPNYAYIGNRWELAIINITNPQSPRRAGSRGAYVHSLWVQGNHCYTATGDQGFTIFNIRDTLNIWEEGRIGTLWSYDIYVIGMFAYTPNFTVIDVSDSSSPTIVGSCNMSSGWPNGVWVKSPFTYGFVADLWEGLTVVNINDPTRPVMDTICFGVASSKDVFVSGSFAYIANVMKGLKILDVSNPAIPFEIGEYDTAGAYPGLETIWICDSIAYLPVWPFRFKSVNVKNPALPVLIGYCSMRSTFDSDIFVKDSLAYIVSTRIFQTIKIKNPNLPESLPSFMLPSSESRGIFIKDTFAYISNADSGLIILNVSDPARPVRRGKFVTSDWVNSTFVKDSLAYVGASRAGLRIVNISNPSSPQEIGFYLPPGYTHAALTADTIAYVSADIAVEVVSVANPSLPYRVGYYQGLAGGATRIFYNGIYLFCACFEAGIYILERTQTSIEEQTIIGPITRKPKLTISPNPARNKLTLELNSQILKNAEIVLYDLTGKIITRRKLEPHFFNDFRTEVLLNNLTSGVYFIVLKAENGQFVEKAIVIH